ncbi:hypothetical protein H257_09176 [Aphanomyces astaci]|uniref:Uncharacterized protein n=1 Tax=Aphanomyces astaci TaxID=112090 RepID=W4GAK8_APHAT|nr:hypothetical protein H257_09176 [Aphanomyces astaci]ETV76700.1 hypothetical protein H257_09176 [Aphanomyces astaci]|eukprot:XP_009833612.1 hypothetical protein H257_09176 [Aphanomyces astaci]
MPSHDTNRRRHPHTLEASFYPWLEAIFFRCASYMCIHCSMDESLDTSTTGDDDDSESLRRMRATTCSYVFSLDSRVFVLHVLLMNAQSVMAAVQSLYMAHCNW